MLSKNQIKFINSLKQKKYREEHNLFIAEGAKIVPELLASGIRVKQVFATSEFLRKHKIANEIERFEIKEAELERISSLMTANEVIALCEIPSYEIDPNSFKEKLALVLDDIKDPGNMGTIIRIADWFGIGNVVCSNNSVDVFNPKVVQATMGSIARIKIHYTDLRSFISEQSELNQLPVFGALLEGENLYSKKLPSAGLIVIGNESKGISEEIQQLLTDKISIPSFSHFSQSGGEAESLNAAIATAIICSEFRRGN
ncbi:MAG: tRNA ((18)-2-O)-methyltransferase [Bacteroidota bacterium]|jgi:TrmH family RNA methyltransferase|nr:tRNA ((18)-2-O)-methyltransferase [Bacteroidota bacterium]